MQNNTAPGPILRRTAGADLSLKEKFVVMLNSDDQVVLHDGSLAKAYVLIDAGIEDAEVGIQALGNAGIRIKSALAHTNAAAVYLDTATGKATPTASAIRLGFAEETKASGEGDVLIRPDVEIAPVGTLAALALTITDPPTQAEVQAIADKVDALIALVKVAR